MTISTMPFTHTFVYSYFWSALLSTTTNIRLGTLSMSCGNIAYLEVKREDLSKVSDSRKKQVRSNQNISHSDLDTKN